MAKPKLEKEKAKPIRTIAVVDGSNVMSESKRFNPKTGEYEITRNWSIDLRKLYDYLTQAKGAKEVIFFGPYYPNNPGSQKLMAKINSIGYHKRTITAVPHYRYEYDKSGRVNKILTSKGNVDAMIPVDLCLRINEYDELLFLSGDGDFLYLLKKLQARKKIVRVYAFADVTSKSIKDHFKGDFIDLTGLKNSLGYTKKPAD